jgi:hypothetical protein
MPTFPRFVRKLVKALHPSVRHTSYQPRPTYPRWSFVVYCGGGRRFEYSGDVLHELYERTPMLFHKRTKP